MPALPLTGIVVGLWGTLPRFVELGLDTDERLEFVDHFIPGLVVVITSVIAVAVTRRTPQPGPFLFLAGLIVLLAGLFMVATHVPLVMQANRGEAPWGGTIFHTSAALAVFCLGAVWAITCWSEAAPQPETEHASTEQ